MANGSYIGQVKIGENYYPVGSILYGVCDTAAATQDKTTILSNYSGTDTGVLNDTSVFDDNNLTKGVTVHIKFINSNTYDGDVYLKVANATKHKIVRYGTTNIGKTAATSWVAGSIVSFTYDGTNWIMNTGIDSNTTYSAISEANIKSTSNTSAGLITGQRFNQALTNRIDTSISNTSTDTQVPSAKAVYNYVDTKTSGLTGAMHFIGITSTALTDGATTATLTPKTTGSLTKTTNFEAGDVVVCNINDKIGQEYVWTGSAWELLGDEGSYALKTNTAVVVKTATLTKNTLPTLTITTKNIPNITSVGTPTTLGTAFSIPNVTNKGSAAEFTVANGTLTLKAGSAPTLGTAFSVPNVTSAGTVPTLGTEISVGSASGWNAGTQASLSTTDETVVKP